MLPTAAKCHYRQEPTGLAQNAVSQTVATRATTFKGVIILMSFSLEGVEIVVFAYILVFLCNRYTSGSEQLPVLLGPQGD